MDIKLHEPSQWVDLYGDALYRFALSRVSSADQAQDLVQDTLIAAISARKRFSGKSSERTWLTGILKHKILDYYRKKGREVAESHLKPDDMESEHFQNHLHGAERPVRWDENPDTVLSNSQLGGILGGCIEKLPVHVKQVFIMREIDKVDSEEVCNILDMSLTNLYVVMHRARKMLKDCIQHQWMEKGVSNDYEL